MVAAPTLSTWVGIEAARHELITTLSRGEWTLVAAFHFVGLVGSVRQRSYNRLLLEAAREALPESAELEILDIAELPFYNQDLEEGGVPASVERLRERIKAADGIILATPEYNYSVPGVLKNAIEWASRPVGNAAMAGKPIALLGASTGLFGTVRAQLAWRQIFAGTNNPVVNRPEVLVAQADKKFDAEGRLVDESTRTFLRQSLASMVAYVESARSLASVR